ncbi:hypothetical protein LTS18_012269, partial [Coniosporium uncinatum]
LPTMASYGPPTNGVAHPPASATQLPPEALDLAAKLFDNARAGQTDTLAQYLSAGIPPVSHLSPQPSLERFNVSFGTLPPPRNLRFNADAHLLLVQKNLTNHAGDTLLMLAGYHGHADTVRLLLSKGADPNVLNDKSQSPLAGATFKGYDDVVRLLYDAGGDPDGGQPNARQAAVIFRKDKYLEWFDAPRQQQSSSGDAGSAPPATASATTATPQESGAGASEGSGDAGAAGAAGESVND